MKIPARLRLYNSLLLLAVLIVPVSSAVSGQPQGSPEAKVDKLFNRYNEGVSPGIAVLAVKDGKVLLKKGYGMANLEHRIPITPETVFDIASVSKQFAGMAVSMLIEEGKVSLKDDIRTRLEQWLARRRRG